MMKFAAASGHLLLLCSILASGIAAAAAAAFAPLLAEPRRGGGAVVVVERGGGHSLALRHRPALSSLSSSSPPSLRPNAPRRYSPALRLVTTARSSSLSHDGDVSLSRLSRRSRRSGSSRCASPTSLSAAVADVEEEGGESPAAASAAAASGVSSQRRFMYMTEEQDRELKEKGDREASLMSQGRVGPLKVSKIKVPRGGSGAGGNKARGAAGFGGGGGGGGGFGGGGAGGKKKGKKKGGKSKMAGVVAEADGAKTAEQQTSRPFAAEAKEYAKLLASDGVIRIDNVLPADLADDLKSYLVDLRARATASVESGEIDNTQMRFADVLLNQNRCDLKVPLGPDPVNRVLRHLLGESTVVRPIIEEVYESYGGAGSRATLWEHNCFMSNGGARRQLVHADSVAHTLGKEPVMLTCFVALQDVDASMGPTTWIKGTHTKEAHDLFYQGSDETKETLLRTREKLVGTLTRGSCAIFDPRTLHCAGGNVCPDPSNTRALFYVSFKNPKIDYPGSPSTSGYGIADAEATMVELCDGLEVACRAADDGRERPSMGNPRLDQILSYP